MTADEDLARALQIVHDLADQVRDELAGLQEAGTRGAWTEFNRLHKMINRLAALRALLVGLIEQRTDES